MKKYKQIKKGSRVTFQADGFIYRAKYSHRYFDKMASEWTYVFHPKKGVWEVNCRSAIILKVASK